MKKRALSMIMMMVLCITMLIPQTAFAAQKQVTYNESTYNDLVNGDVYGIYPLSWYESKSITKDKINEANFRVLLAGLKNKILKTECATQKYDPEINTKSTMKVSDVLNAYYELLKSYEYKTDIGLKENQTAIAFMEEHKIYVKEKDVSLTKKCTYETAMGLASRVVSYLYSTLDAGSKGFLWEIENKGNKVYLLGSIHIANPDIYPFSDDIIDAYQASDALVVEADILGGYDQNDLLKYCVYQDGTTLKDHVSEETYKQVVKAGSYMGLSEEQINSLTSFYIWQIINSANMTATGADSSESSSVNGVDVQFLLQAAIDKKPIYELEGVLYQYDLLYSFSDELKEMLLSGSVAEYVGIAEGTMEPEQDNSSASLLNQMLECWRVGDQEGLMKLMSSDVSGLELSDEDMKTYKTIMDEYQNKLFTQRDKNMADNIEKLLKGEGSTTYFIVVGSGHYVSEYSVVDMLKEKGFTLKEIK